MPVLQKKALFSAFIICQVLRIIQNYMEVSPAKSLILSATIHGGSYFFIQPKIGAPKEKSCNSSLSVCFQHYIDNNVLVVYNVYVVTSH